MEEVTKLQMLKNKMLNKHAFTLVELLVVMSIIGVLASLAVGSFRTAQMRGRDVQRKSDLKEVSHAVELYYADYGQYPAENAIVWGSEFEDAKGTVYFKTLPTDPTSTYTYVYKLITGSTQKYQLFAYLENSKDINIIPPANIKVISCNGGKNCNFAVTSANTNASE